MNVYPAIDLIDGGVVRLWKGRFDRTTTYDAAPVDIAGAYADGGADRIHVIDLDGARVGQPKNLGVLENLTRRLNGRATIQWGGGLRDDSAVASVLDAGAGRAIVGSVAVRDPNTVGEWITRFGADRVVVALDVRPVLDDPVRYVPATSGWTEEADRDLWDLLDVLQSLGLRHVLSTDIERDGTGAGPNLALYRELVRRYPSLAIQASGGVGSRDHLDALRETGVSAVVVGKSLLDGTITLAEAIA